jgi:uncharacterized protein YndB with AHSA1/START domain
MPITSTSSDPKQLTVTIVGDYPVPVERLWDAYADPRQLERFWGPEGWPATFTRHDMAAGGESQYWMTGPDGSRSGGWFHFLKVEPGKLIEIEEGFAHDDGRRNASMPTMRMTFSFERTKQGSRCTALTRYPTLEAMELLVDKMQMLEGMRSAMGQLDGVVADLASFAASRATESQILSDTEVRVSRIIRGTPREVWRAHHEPDLMKRWLTGPDGWTMPVCDVAKKVGDSYRYEWEAVDGSQRFGFEGELLESDAPHRAVTTERMIGMEGPGTENVLTLTPVEGGTLMTLVITYPSREVRDMVLGTGMVAGMESSYARLEEQVLAAA